jgi:hypothetical protein
MSTNRLVPAPNCRLVLPSPNDPNDPANLQALLLWANNFVVNKVVAGPATSIQSQSQALGSGAEGTGIVTVNAVGGYASLTGPGTQQTPGDLTQLGGFTVVDNVGDGIALATVGGLLIASSGLAQIQAGAELTLTSSTTTAIQGFAGNATQASIQLYAAQYGMSWASNAANFYMYIATTGAGLQSPPAGQVAWGFTENGQLWYYPSGGPWTLVSSSAGTGVTSFNTRSGAVTLTAADVEALFTAKGQLFLGTGSGTGALLAIGSTGQVATVSGGTVVWATPASGVSPATTVTGPDALGTSAVVGTSLLYARQDHDHGLSSAATLGLMLTSVYDPAAIAQQVVGTTASQTLTNKTLTSPVISSISNTGTLTLPTSTDTLVGRATTDTLTNKRITKRVSATAGPGATPSMDTDNYDLFAFTALAANITSMTTNLTGTPVAGDLLWMQFTDNGTARTFAWGSSFEASTVPLPTTTVISTALDVLCRWNTVTSKWRCISVA